MGRILLFISAVAVVYVGGFVYDEVGPLLYAVMVALIASTPLLTKFSFWKKIIFMIPLLVLRVVGKVMLKVFGKNALSKLLTRYGLLEARFNRTLASFVETRNRALERWKSPSRASQAYLLLIFFPVAVLLFLLSLVIKIVRLRFLQFVIEKLMQSYLMKWTNRRMDAGKQNAINAAKSPDSQSSVNTSENPQNKKTDQA